MEQLAPVIAWVKNNRFWLGCGLVSVLMAGIFLITLNATNKTRKKRESTISGLTGMVNSIRSTNATGIDVDEDNVSAHPNNSTNAGMKKRIADAEKSAIDAWVRRYNLQKDLLIFPESEINNPDFMTKIKQYIPAELGVDAVDFDAAGELRIIYKEMLNDRMTQLAETVGTTWNFRANQTTQRKTDGDNAQIATPAGGGAGATPDGGDVGLNLNADIVNWNDENQKLWRQKITQFRSEDEAPTLYEILLLQEDLWVFESVLGIVAEVNKGSDANDLADIKKIDHILVGREAYLNHGDMTISAPNIDPGIVDDQTGVAKKAKSDLSVGKIGSGKKKPFRRGEQPKGPTDREKGAFDFKNSMDPSHGRYVDADYYPIPADDVLKGVLADELTNYASLTVAKRIPVRIAVVMNEKQIGEFLSACSNSKLVFEVRQVRINRHKPGDGAFILGQNAAGSSGGSGASGSNKPKAPLNAPAASGGSAAGASIGGEFERSGTAGGSGLDGGGGATGSGAARTSYNVMVEFYGIVKIYNPVKYDLLGGQAPTTSGSDSDQGKTDGKKSGKAKPKTDP